MTVVFIFGHFNKDYPFVLFISTLSLGIFLIFLILKSFFIHPNLIDDLKDADYFDLKKLSEQIITIIFTIVGANSVEIKSNNANLTSWFLILKIAIGILIQLGAFLVTYSKEINLLE